MQSWREYFCKPCSASVTSPQEDMEYRMGSCIGVARSQVNAASFQLQAQWQNVNECEDIAGCAVVVRRG